MLAASALRGEPGDAASGGTRCAAITNGRGDWEVLWNGLAKR